MMGSCLQQSRAAPNPSIMLDVTDYINSMLFWRFHSLIFLSVWQWDLKWCFFNIFIMYLSCSFRYYDYICNNILKVRSCLPLVGKFSQAKSSHSSKNYWTQSGKVFPTHILQWVQVGHVNSQQKAGLHKSLHYCQLTVDFFACKISPNMLF